MKDKFKEILKGKVVIVGIGNPLRGDDGFGPAFIEKLQGNTKAICIDAGTAPESYTGKIIKEKPDTILIADVVHLEKAHGECEILEGDDLVNSGLTTHNLSPKVFIEYLRNETDAGIYMLGVQPQKVAFGDEMSDPIKNTLEETTKIIMEICNA